VAKDKGTKVILMAMERITEITKRLIEHGMSPKTPVGMVRWGTTGQQQSIVGTLATIPKVVEESKFGAPAVTVIGDVVSLRDKLNWFEKRPLFGQRIVVTRTREQASQLSKQLRELGAEVLEIPTIRIEAPVEKDDLKDALLGLHEYDWVVFTSPNGVTSFFNYFFQAFDDLRDIGGVKIGAVGPATAAKLKELHLRVDAMPEEYVSSKIAKALGEVESVENLRVLLVRAEVANPELPKELESMGAIVDDVASYQTVPETEDRNGAAAKLMEAGADWLTFTSSSTVENFHRRFNLGELVKKFPQMKVASIGPETTKTLKELGVSPAIEAKPHNIEGIVTGIRGATGKKVKKA
jgi:uroporphyrinogen III methyltransferase / synthase